MKRTSPTERPTSWWLDVLRRREAKMHDEYVEPDTEIRWSNAEEQRAVRVLDWYRN